MIITVIIIEASTFPRDTGIPGNDRMTGIMTLVVVTIEVGIILNFDRQERSLGVEVEAEVGAEVQPHKCTASLQSTLIIGSMSRALVLENMVVKELIGTGETIEVDAIADQRMNLITPETAVHDLKVIVGGADVINELIDSNRKVHVGRCQQET